MIRIMMCGNQYGEEAEIVNHYNELRVCLKEETSLERELNIIFSSFDDGMGFRYEFPRQQQLQEFLIDDEVTEFVFLQIMMLGVFQ